MSLLSQPINISIILCSRQRVESLRALLDSLAANCKNPINYEVLVACDKDDLDTYKFYEAKLGQTEKYLNVRFRFEERVVNLHYRLNKLTTIGRGRMFWVLNDDCLVETKNWDKIIIDTIEQYLKDKSDRIACGNVQCNSADKIGDYSAFPVITKEAVEAVGFFMPDTIRVWGADYYIHELYKSLDREVPIPQLVVNHFLHSSEAVKYENPLRKEILEWHKTNNIDLLGDLKLALHHINEPRNKLLTRLMKHEI